MSYQDLGYRHRSVRSTLGRSFIPRPGSRYTGPAEPVSSASEAAPVEAPTGFWATHKGQLAVCLGALLIGLYTLLWYVTGAHVHDKAEGFVDVMAYPAAILSVLGAVVPVLLYRRHRRLERALDASRDLTPDSEG